MTRCGPRAFALVISIGWGLSGCAINVRKGPNLPGESKTSSRSADATVVVPVGSAADGRRFYSRYCEDCHNPINKSTKAGATTAAILNAIAEVPEMADLERLKVSEISSIAEALKK